MNWDKLKQRALVPFEGRPGQLDIRAGLYLDEAQEDFALHTKCYVKKVNIYITKDKVFIDLPKDFVEFTDNPIFRGEYLTPSTYGGMHYNKEIETNLLNTGSPIEFAVENRKFYFLPRPSTAGVLTITYIAVPNSLRSSTGLKQLRFDNVVSEYFEVGDVIKSRIGASNSTTSVATIERVDYDSPSGGVLTLSNITNGFTTDNEDFFVSGDESDHYASSYGTNWNSITTTWNNMGFGGIATVNGPQYSYTDLSPEIPDVYHYLLVDYVKAQIHQDLGNTKAFQNHYSLYVGHKEKARTTVANAKYGDKSYVTDSLSVNVI
tara:strand:+ start:2734 stop:3693 length:960 start_codon:yes stop_codon:yes gene_type:complete